ncbi:MAG: M23 family metallopeptidase [Rikenellaceae bacterium]
MQKKEHKEILGQPDSTTKRRQISRWKIELLVGLLLVVLFNTLYLTLFESQQTQKLSADQNDLIDQYRVIDEKIKASQSRVRQIAKRDNLIYRSLFALDTLNTASWSKPYPDTYYAHFDDNPYTPMVQRRWRSIDILAKMIYFQSLSLDQIEPMVKNSTDLSEAIPAIWPIDRTALKHGIGAFGRRLHPIYKRYLNHKGVDMACDTGTPVYATGNAVVERSYQGYRRSGYGQQLLLRHEYGYQTRYAHLSKRLVNVGDTVKRGDIIGLVGSTGGSTGPHLHYEVIYRNVAVNPISFFNRNMSKEEYAELMKQTYITDLDKTDGEFEDIE